MENGIAFRGEVHPPLKDLKNEFRLHRWLEMDLLDDAQLADRVALMEWDGTRHITFGQLNREADRLANRLLKAMNNNTPALSDQDQIVAVCLPSSIDLIVGLLAILKTGSAYLPLDPSFPFDRINYILEDAKPTLVLSSASVLKSSPALAAALENNSNATRLFDLEAEANADDDEIAIDLPHMTEQKNLAVVLYTSGSTGTPKGVRLEHSSLLHRLNWQWRVFEYSPEEIACFKTALTFVDATTEIWAPLLAGRPLLIVPKQIVQDTERFIDLLDQARITRLVLVPSLLKAIISLLKSPKIKSDRTGQSTALQHLKMWVCSGEVLTSQLLLEFYDVFPSGTTICNYYGSTEVTGDVTYASFKSREQALEAIFKDKVPIGKPMDNCAIYLLDSDKKMVKDGEIGEIYVAGKHLCSGYVNNREMERFVLNHVDNDSGFKMMFRTGDYGRVTNGQLYYEGRTDSQIKVRGHRVDLNEISTTVSRMEQVASSAVLCYKPGEPEQELVAFIVPKPCCTMDVVEMKMKEKLLSYMMPTVVGVDELPLLHNGKIDRQKLLRLFDDQKTRQMNGSCLLDEEKDWSKEEKALIKTARMLTGRPVRLTDNFFNVGGNSLNAVTFVTKLRDQGFDIDISTFLSADRLEQLVPIMREQHCTSPPTDTLPSKYTLEMLKHSMRDEIVTFLGTSFSQKETLAVHGNLTMEDFEILYDEALWNMLVAADLSFVLKNEKGEMMGVVTNMDCYDEHHLEPNPRMRRGMLYVFELFDRIEGPVMKEYFDKPARNQVMHGFMAATAESASPAEAIGLFRLLETESVNLARRKGYSKIVTTNTNALTRGICEDLLGYQVLSENQINQFVAADGTRPFGDAPDSAYATVAIKHIG